MRQNITGTRGNCVTQPQGGQLSPRFFRQIVEASGAPIIVFEHDGRRSVVRFVNEAFCRRTGYAADEILGTDWWARHTGHGNDPALAQLRRALREAREMQIQLRSVCKDGSTFWCHCDIAPVTDNDGSDQCYIGVLRDISQERHELEQLRRTALYDPLTGLANRRLLADRFHQMAAHARRTDHQFALALIDLNDFKQVNDTFGHSAGDDLLRVIATRLVRSLRAEDTVARLGGDEFAVLIDSLGEYDSVRAIEARIKAIIEQPVELQEQVMRPSGSIGVSLCPADGLEFEALLDHVDRRMYAQKQPRRAVNSLC
jgi:diguanylate cyclase (GGDEF)-like protein/PAS domain S-box-containing protein